jgi:hypothetical protein
VDPIGNFPYITAKHRSLAVKALKKDPSLYAKFANVKTPMGFTVRYLLTQRIYSFITYYMCINDDHINV